MPVVFVHGVGVRENETYDSNVKQRNKAIKELVLSQLDLKPHHVNVFNPYWGKYATDLKWGGASLPSRQVESLDLFLDTSTQEYRDEQLLTELLSGMDIVSDKPNKMLKTIASESLTVAVDLLFALASEKLASGQDDEELTELIRQSERLYAYAEAEPEPDWLATVNTDNDFVEKLRNAVDEWQAPPPVESLGLTDWWDPLHEGVVRFRSAAGSWGSRALLHFTRKPLNNAVTHFTGDVFTYLNKRGCIEQPGPIIQKIASQLDKAVAAIDPERDPYLIIIAHSMGGNITYDLLTHFYPDKYAVDLLVTVGSQVALFEELKLYKESDEAIPNEQQQRVAKPSCVRHWLNVYDRNDVLSYAAKNVFEGVTDDPYATGAGVLTAHTSYFLRGSFYRRLGKQAHELLINS